MQINLAPDPSLLAIMVIFIFLRKISPTVIASVAFGGPDLKTVYLGNLAGQAIPTFRSPIAGAEPVQWRF